MHLTLHTHTQAPWHTLRTCLVWLRCLLFQQCVQCVLPAFSSLGRVTQSPYTHSAWMTASSSHDAAGATRLVPPQLCTRTVHRVKGCHWGGTDSVREQFWKTQSIKSLINSFDLLIKSSLIVLVWTCLTGPLIYWVPGQHHIVWRNITDLQGQLHFSLKSTGT